MAFEKLREEKEEAERLRIRSEWEAAEAKERQEKSMAQGNAKGKLVLQEYEEVFWKLAGEMSHLIERSLTNEPGLSRIFGLSSVRTRAKKRSGGCNHPHIIAYFDIPKRGVNVRIHYVRLDSSFGSMISFKSAIGTIVLNSDYLSYDIGNERSGYIDLKDRTKPEIETWLESKFEEHCRGILRLKEAEGW